MSLNMLLDESGWSSPEDVQFMIEYYQSLTKDESFRLINRLNRKYSSEDVVINFMVRVMGEQIYFHRLIRRFPKKQSLFQRLFSPTLKTQLKKKVNELVDQRFLYFQEAFSNAPPHQLTEWSFDEMKRILLNNPQVVDKYLNDDSHMKDYPQIKNIKCLKTKFLELSQARLRSPWLGIEFID